MTKPIDGPLIIQDDIAFIRSTFMLQFMNIKQGRRTDDCHIEADSKQFCILYDMFCTARYKQYQEPNPALRFSELGTPPEYFSITFNDSENETQITLAVSKI